MNKQYWENFYRDNPHLVNTPTDFALFCQQYIKPKSLIIDMGCGNGRDSYYFGKLQHKAIGVDYAIMPKHQEGAVFIKTDIKSFYNMECNADVIYSRFFIHAITLKEVCEFLRWSKGLFMAEFRAKGDKPILYPGHKRTLLDDREVLNLMHKYGFEVLFYEKGHGLASHKGEDPLVIRVVAKK